MYLLEAGIYDCDTSLCITVFDYFFYCAGIQRQLSTTQSAYCNAPFSIAATSHLVMQFCLRNHLPYSSMAELLQLLDNILPQDNHLAKSLHCFKKECTSHKSNKKWAYCANCLKEISADSKTCLKPACKVIGSGICWYMSLQFIAHLEQICQGISILPATHLY